MIDSVIFDMDGLMFDTERVWATLWEPALATLGLSYKEGLDVAARGTAGDTMRAVLRRFYGENCHGWTRSTSPWRWLPPAGWRLSGIIWTAGV